MEAGQSRPSQEQPGVPFVVVGVGASAVGLEAFTQLLAALPSNTDMAFVLVQHLAPTHPSALAEILSRATSMPVREVHGEPTIEPNHMAVATASAMMERQVAQMHLIFATKNRVPRLVPKCARSFSNIWAETIRGLRGLSQGVNWWQSSRNPQSNLTSGTSCSTPAGVPGS